MATVYEGLPPITFMCSCIFDTCFALNANQNFSALLILICILSLSPVLILI